MSFLDHIKQRRTIYAVGKNVALTPEQIEIAVKQGMNLEQLKGQAELVLMQKHLPRLISQAAKNYAATQKEKFISGRKGGINLGGGAIEVHDDNLGSSLDEVYDELEASIKQG